MKFYTFAVLKRILNAHLTTNAEASTEATESVSIGNEEGDCGLHLNSFSHSGFSRSILKWLWWIIQNDWFNQSTANDVTNNLIFTDREHFNCQVTFGVLLLRSEVHCTFSNLFESPHIGVCNGLLRKVPIVGAPAFPSTIVIADGAHWIERLWQTTNCCALEHRKRWQDP